jgi:tRNA threonylcarbamoyladenosine biosynthesis protein TsaE
MDKTKIMKKITIRTHSLEETVRLGEVIARSIDPGKGILLTGDLGTGKTTIISGLCRGLGVKDQVKSPTFVLTWVYESAKAPVYHIDLYRLDDYCELENIGWEEMVEENRIYMVEWADRFPLPYTEQSLSINLEYGENPEDRTIDITFDENIYPNLEKDLADYENSRI